MRKFFCFLIVLSSIIALFAINNKDATFSFEDYLTKISVVAEEQPRFPSTDKITKVILEYGSYDADTSGIIKAVKAVWTTLKLIYECVVFAVMFLIYVAEMIVFVCKIACACCYNLLVW